MMGGRQKHELSLRSAEFKLDFCPCVTVLFKRVKTVARGWFQELKSQSHRW